MDELCRVPCVTNRASDYKKIPVVDKMQQLVEKNC